MKKILLSFALAVGLLTSASTLQAQVNMSRYITLTVSKDSAIRLDFMAASNGTPVRIVSGSNTQDITVGTDWYDGGTPTNFTVTAGASTMTVYGDLTGFGCEMNRANLTVLDPSHNTQLKELFCNENTLNSLDVSGCTQLTVLYCNNNTLSSLDVSKNTQLRLLSCYSNQLTSLDVSKNTQLTALGCRSNQLTSLDVSKNTQLRLLSCHSNQLTSLDVSKNTQLKKLYCHSNQLTSLDVSKNTELEGLNCANNKLNSLDVSKNTQLEKLYCSGNKFTTATLDDIYCTLPDRTRETNGVIQPVYNSSSSNHATVLATNKQNATAKNWKVQYYQNNTDIPATTGSYVCSTPEPNMSRYITLTVKSGEAIKIDFKAAAAATPVRIVSGSNTKNITVDTGWYDGNAPSNYTVTAGASTMTVYGDLTGFYCEGNEANLTALDPSHNTQLKELWCGFNQLTTLDVSNNTQLMALSCHTNQLTSLDVSKNTQLKWLYCFSNQLTSLDVSKNTQLTKLYCNNNSLNSLDISHNTQLTLLSCPYNGLSSLDVSNNTQLEALYCHGNNLSTLALDDIFCSLPDRRGKTNGWIQPVYSNSLSDNAIVLATNKANAINKNWKVQYYENNTDIPATTGTYTCPQPNMSRYITLTVKSGENIKLDFWADAAGTPVRIVSGSNTQDIRVGTSWTGFSSYTAGSTTMTIYGDITRFDCSGNGANLTAIDPSHNTQLEMLYCYSNTLSSLDVSQNTQLTLLSCKNNNLTTLDVSKNTQLKKLYCHSNQLTSLDVSKNTKLTTLYCHGNNFSTQALDAIYCALPVRSASDNAKIVPVESASAPNHATVLATNAANATAKNWKVQYYKNDADIPATTGKHKCSATDIAEAAAEQALTLYPNPVADVLYLSATARTIRVYNMYGIEVAHATDTDRVEVSHLPAGVYTVKADGTVAKMVKR